MRPAQLDQRRLIYQGVNNRHLGACPYDESQSFCCQCYDAHTGQWFETCMSYTQEYIDICEHDMGYAQCGVKAGDNPICPDFPCNLGRRAFIPPGGFKLGVRVTFSGFDNTTLDSSAELLADPNRSIRCPLVSSQPREALFVGAETDANGVAAVEVRIRRTWPVNYWIMYGYALTRVRGELYRLMFFLGGGDNWDRMLAGEAVQSPNRATVSGNQAGILAHPAGRAEIILDRSV